MASRQWKRLYKRRGSVERMFSGLKRSRMLTEHRCFNIRRVRLHVGLSLLTYAGSMLARLLAGEYHRMRDMAIQLPPSVSAPTSPAYALAA